MKKRQKYDPRKAIEEAKNKTEGKSKSKSAFPEGMLKKKEDKGRSQTARPNMEEEED